MVGRVALALALGCVLACLLAGWFAPRLNWDMLAYAGLAKTWLGAADPHAAAYADAEVYAAARGMADVLHSASINPASGYQAAVAADPAAFANQLPFYAIRPLYIALVVLVSLLTGSAAAATLLITLAAVAVTCLAVLGYGVQRLGLLAGSLACALYALAPTTLTVVRFSTPDALLTMLAAVTFLLLAERRVVSGAAVLLVGAFIRSDLILLNALLAGALLVQDWRTHLPAIALLVASVVLVKLVEALTGNYGYAVLWHHTFTGFSPNPSAYADLPLQPMVMLQTILRGVRDNLGSGALWTVLAPLLCASALFLRARLNWRDQRYAAAGAVLLYLPARLILFPSQDVRLMAPMVAASTMLLIAAVALQRQQQP